MLSPCGLVQDGSEHTKLSAVLAEREASGKGAFAGLAILKHLFLCHKFAQCVLCLHIDNGAFLELETQLFSM